MLVTSIFSFSHNVFYLYIYRNNLATFLLSSANPFSLVQSIISSSPKESRRNLFTPIKLFTLVHIFQPFTKRQIFTVVQIENNCRRQIKFGRKIEICFVTDRKHCVKRRKCWLPVFSPFPTMFSKGFYITLSQTNPVFFTCVQYKSFEKHCGKRRNCSSRAISPFPTVFFTGL